MEFLGRFVMVIVGMAVILFAFFYFERRRSITSNGVQVKGKIVDYMYLSSGDYAFMYMYYVDHKKYISPLLIGTMSTMTKWDRRKIGKYFDIIYDKDSPDKIIEAHNHLMSGFMILCILFGLFLIYLPFHALG